jgi:hypothetical protein
MLATSLSLANMNSATPSTIHQSKSRLSTSSEPYIETHRNIEKYSQELRRKSYENSIRTRRYSTEIHNTVNPQYKKKKYGVFGFKSNVSKLLAKFKLALFKCMKRSH